MYLNAIFLGNEEKNSEHSEFAIIAYTVDYVEQRQSCSKTYLEYLCRYDDCLVIHKPAGICNLKQKKTTNLVLSILGNTIIYSDVSWISVFLIGACLLTGDC